MTERKKENAILSREAKQSSQGGWAGSQPAGATGLEAWNQQAFAALRRPLIIFDLDGTLVDSYQTSVDSYRLVLEMLGLPPAPLPVLEALNGPTVEGCCRLLGLPQERQPEFEAALADVTDRLVPEQGRAFPGTLEMLAALQPLATLCLLTNGSTHYMELACEVIGLGGFFAERLAFTPGYTKAMRIAEWMAKFGATRTLMVGDRATDMAAAHAAGAQALGVTFGTGAVTEFTEADALAHNMSEVRACCLAFCEEA